MNSIEYERRLHACLDAHEDPLDDAELCAFLAEHAGHLAGFATLRSCLRGLRADGAKPGSGLRTLVASAPARRRLSSAWLAITGTIAGTIAAAAAALFACLHLASQPPRARPTTPTGRILAASLEELRPRAYLAANFTVHETLLATPTATLETYETRSEVR